MQDTRAIQVACILKNPEFTYWALCGQGLRDLAHERGVALAIRPVAAVAEMQPAFLECLRQPGLDALILAGVDCAFTGSAGPRIPVIACDGSLRGAAPACDLRPDVRRAATLATTYLVERLHGQGKVVHIQGPQANVGEPRPRTEGFAEVLAQHPGVRVVVETEGDWTRQTAARIVQAALAEHPDLRGVFADTDLMALGALDALEAAGCADVVVVGINGIPEAMTAIHAGRMGASVDLAPYNLGRETLKHALQLAQRQPTPATVRTDVRLITRDTLLDATLDTVHVFPNVLRDLVVGSQAQQRLQEEIIATQQRLIQELSTPIIPVNDSTLVVPLIGTIDSVRAAQITESLLEAVSRQQTQVLIIDITGVAVVDTGVIHYLLQTASAARLLGTTVLLVGIGPEVAQTIVQLGVDLSSIITRSTLQAGLEYAAAKRRR